MKRVLLFVTYPLLVLLAGAMAWFWVWLVTSPQTVLAQDNHKVEVCHVPPGNPENAHAVEVDRHAWENGHSPHNAHALDWLLSDYPDRSCPEEGNGEDGNGEDGNGDLPPPDGGDDQNGGQEGNGEPPVDSGDGPSPTNGTTPSTCPLGYELTVVAVMADWTPIPGVEVLVQRGAESFTVVTGESGQVSFPADFGLYRFTVLTAPQLSWRELVLETTLGAGSEDDRGVCWDDVVFIDPPSGADMRGFGLYLLLYGIGLWLAHFEYRRMQRDIERQ